MAAHVDDAMLQEIADADYTAGAQLHYDALLGMRDKGLLPAFAWHPHEVLELIRWSEPDRPDHKPGGAGVRGHWMRAFCCAALLRSAGTADMGAYNSFNETVAGLVASLEAVGADLWNEAGSLLTWFVDRTASAGYAEEDAFLGVALLHCALRAGGVADDAIVALCRWIAEREKAVVGRFPTDDTWLHRTTPHDQRRDTWTMLARVLEGVDMRARSTDAREWTNLIITSLA
ncbi:MAG: hypothetical protein WC729_05315 [Sphingomonas sp.]|uniref:hypothetical protein n=1 Tax=Sphingomonas sp. TaxID=28214 RepID=UPI003567940D